MFRFLYQFQISVLFRRHLAEILRQPFWTDLKSKSVEKTDASLVYSFPITEKCFDAKISVVLPKNSVTENPVL